MNQIRNELVKKKTQAIAIELLQKVKQFSLFFKSLPEYHDCVNLCVSNGSDEINVATSSLPINLVQGHAGSPWYNAVVVDEDKQELRGFFKDVVSKKALLADSEKKFWPVQTKNQECLCLEYIVAPSHLT